MGALISGSETTLSARKVGITGLYDRVLRTGLGLVFEYLIISFHRGGLELPPELLWKLLMTALFSSLVSPFLLLLFSRVADRMRYRIRTEGLKRRHTYDGDAL